MAQLRASTSNHSPPLSPPPVVGQDATKARGPKTHARTASFGGGGGGGGGGLDPFGGVGGVGEHDDDIIEGGKGSGAAHTAMVDRGAVGPAALAKTTPLQSAFNLMNSITGLGLLGLPFCFRECGALLATLLLLTCAAGSYFSLHCLLYCCQRTGCHSYVALASHAFGPRMRHFTQGAIITLQFGTIVASVNALTDLFTSVASSVLPAGASAGRASIMTMGTLMGVFPVAILVPNNQVLAPVSALVVGFLVFFTAYTVFIAAKPEAVFAADPMIAEDPEGVILALPILCFAFTAHCSLFPVFNSLRRPSHVGWSAHVSSMAAVVRGALAVCVAMYAAVGFFGYAAFREHTSGNVMRNFGGFHELGRTSSMHMFKLGFGCEVCGSIPVTLLPLRDNVLPFVVPGIDHPKMVSRRALAVVTAGILGAVLTCAIIVPNVEIICALTGSTAAVVLAYILPAALYLNLQGKPSAVADSSSSSGGGGGGGGGGGDFSYDFEMKGMKKGKKDSEPDISGMLDDDDDGESEIMMSGTPSKAMMDARAAGAVVRLAGGGGGGGGKGGGSSSSSSSLKNHHHHEVMGRMGGAFGRHVATVMLLVGLVVGVVCTLNSLRAVKEEADSVALVNDLIKHGAVAGEMAAAAEAVQGTAAAAAAATVHALETKGHISALHSALGTSGSAGGGGDGGGDGEGVGEGGGDGGESDGGGTDKVQKSEEGSSAEEEEFPPVARDTLAALIDQALRRHDALNATSSPLVSAAAALPAHADAARHAAAVVDEEAALADQLARTMDEMLAAGEQAPHQPVPSGERTKVEAMLRARRGAEKRAVSAVGDLHVSAEREREASAAALEAALARWGGAS